MKLNLDFTAVTLLKDWWKTVKENFTQIEDYFNSHSTNSVLDHPNGSVTTSKLASRAVTKTKLAQDIINQLDDFQEHIDNPSEEIADGAVTKVKLAKEERSGYEKSVITAGFINNLYGCRAFPWTKNEMVLTDEEFSNEFEIHDYDQVINEKFTEDVWYIYNHDGTFNIVSFNYFENEDSDEFYFGMRGRYITQKGIYALKFHTDTTAASGEISSGICTVIKIAEGSLEDMIAGKNIADEAVTTAKIADEAITEAKIADELKEKINSNGGTVSIDDTLSYTSENAVQNKIVTAELDKKYEASALAEEFLDNLWSGVNNLYRFSCNACFPSVYADMFLFDLPINGFNDMAEVTQAILDLEDRVNSLSA